MSVGFFIAQKEKTMNVGDKIFTEHLIGEVIELLDNNMVGINFDHRNDRESNYNRVSIKLI